MGVLKDVEMFLASAERLADDGVPSASMALLDEPSGYIQTHVITKGYENPETVYQAGNISMGITALAIAKLIDSGRLSYETRVVEYVPEGMLEVIGRSELMEQVTVGLLVSHRSGLGASQGDGVGYEEGEAMPNYEQYFAGTLPCKTPRVKFASFPGSQCSISLAGYMLLQVLLEKVTGMPFADLMRTIVLEPLGMHRSCFGNLLPEEQNFARPHRTSFSQIQPYGRGYLTFPNLAASGLWTTPSDLLRATAAIQNSLYANENDPTFLIRQSADHMLARVTPNLPSNEQSYGYSVNDTFLALSSNISPTTTTTPTETGFSSYLIAAHGYAPPLPQILRTQSPSRMSLAIMTNSTLGSKTIKNLLSAIFCLKAYPLYQCLPAFGPTDRLIPYPGPEGIFIGDEWKDFLGHWTAAPLPVPSQTKKRSAPGSTPSSTTSTSTPGFGEWEIYDDADMPYLAFDGFALPVRLKGGAMPWQRVEGDPRHEVCLVADGLEMAVRLIYKDDGDKIIELMQENVTVLRRA